MTLRVRTTSGMTNNGVRAKVTPTVTTTDVKKQGPETTVTTTDRMKQGPEQTVTTTDGIKQGPEQTVTTTDGMKQGNGNDSDDYRRNETGEWK